MNQKNQESQDSSGEDSQTAQLNNEKEKEGGSKKEGQKVELSKQRVLVSLSGGMDSIAAIYLLQQQGLEVIGISFVLHENFEVKVLREEENAKGKKKKKGYSSFEEEEKNKYRQQRVTTSCENPKLEELKKICDHFKISFYAVNGREHFKARVLRPLAESQLGGKAFPTCLHCLNTRLELLVEKADMLGAYYIASGHYAKVYKNEKEKIYQIMRANDKKFDQSYYFSLAGPELLKRLVLPVADIRREEVIRIIDRAGVTPLKKDFYPGLCLNEHKYFSEVVNSLLPSGLKNHGSFYEISENHQEGDHHGVHEFQVGQKKLTSSNVYDNIDKSFEVIRMDPVSSKVYVGRGSVTKFSHLELVHLNLSFINNTIKPLGIFVKNHPQSEFVQVFIYIKGAGTALVEFMEPLAHYGEGQVLTFYDKDKAGGKILGYGIINRAFNFEVENRTDFLEAKEYDSDDNIIKIPNRTLSF